MRLAFASLWSHKGRSFQLIMGLLLSLLCIVTALTLTRHLETQFHQYIYSLVPASGISFSIPLSTIFIYRFSRSAPATTRNT